MLYEAAYPLLHRAEQLGMRTGRLRGRLDALELYTEKELTVERDAGAGGLPHVWDGRWRSL